jgi:hypothetical protein
MRTSHLVLAAIAVIVAGGIALYAQSPSQGRDDFAGKAASVFRDKFPGYEVTIADPQTINVSKGGKIILHVYLDNIFHVCEANPGNCNSELAHFASTMARSLDDKPLARTVDTLRIIIRPDEYLKAAAAATSGKAALVEAPIAANLVMICATDLPDAVVPLSVSDALKLNLTPEQAIARCKANTAATLPLPISEVQPLDPHTLGTLKEARGQADRRHGSHALRAG